MKIDKKKQSKNLIDARSARDMKTYMTSQTSLQGRKRTERSLVEATRVRPIDKKLLGFDAKDMERSVKRSKKQDRLVKK